MSIRQLKPDGTGAAGGTVQFAALGLGVSPAHPLHVFGKSLFQNTGAASLFIVDRTDGKIAALGAGGASATLAYDETGTFKVESNTRANVAAGTFGTGATTRFQIDASGNVSVGALAALATNAANGFFYIPTTAGTPTGTPTAVAGKVPVVYDTVNNKFYVYSGGAWRSVTLT